MRESKIEQKVCEYAKAKGFLVYKFSSPGNRGVPDRIFMKNGRMFFIEFKATGKTTTALQDKVIDGISRQGFPVFIVDNIEDGYDAIDLYETGPVLNNVKPIKSA